MGVTRIRIDHEQVEITPGEITRVVRESIEFEEKKPK
jgi:hypothetical protein